MVTELLWERTNNHSIDIKSSEAGTAYPSGAPEFIPGF